MARIATNACLTFLKRRGRENLSALDPVLLADPLTPLAALSRRELLREVERAVEALPPRQRAAIVQRKYQGLSYAEIASSLDCSQDTARAHVYQGLRRLREQFSDEPEVYYE